MIERDFVTEAKHGVVCNIGQVDPAGKRKLDAAAKKGELVKWRGYWWPLSGAPWGIGPLKTCWHTHNPFEGKNYG